MTRFTMAAACALVMSLITVLVVDAAETDLGTITSADLSSDGRQITLRFEGTVGAHRTYVLENPSRLVMDFPNATLGSVKRKIAGSILAIKEVRLGQHEGRSRLVADFGSRPVPPFKISRVGGQIFVTFPKSAGEDDVPRQSALQRTGEKKASMKQLQTAATGGGAPVVVKKAGVEGGVVFVELGSSADQGRRYRVVIDCNLDELSVRSATVSDQAGALRRFDLAEVPPEPVGSADMRTNRGPTRNMVSQQKESVPLRKFKWGLPAGDRERLAPVAQKKGPFQLEEFKLQARRTAEKG
ncbi:MAG: AMIN domain-containing protein [Thermodesulfobacteriota bacterium]